MQAHSDEELEEWNERYQWRKMKKDLAKSRDLLSSIDILLDEYNSSSNKTSVVSIIRTFK